MAKIAKVEPLVQQALINNHKTRSDDFILVLEVYKNFIAPSVSIEAALKHHNTYGLPSFASIIRIRRKLQIKHPELCEAPAVKTRSEAEADYRAYALNN